jgi:hypothetical protein
VLVAGWVGGVAVGLLWGLFGTDGLEQIRTALLELRSAGYRVNARAWRLEV